MLKTAVLARALAALDGGRDADALAALVEAWRARRSVELATLVDHLETRLGKRRHDKAIKRTAEMTVTYLTKHGGDDDPRLGSVLLDVLASPPFLTSSPFWTAVLDLAERLGDPRVAAATPTALEVLRVRLSPVALRDRITTRLGAIAAAIPHVPPPATDEAQLEAAIAARLSRERRAHRDEEDVLAEIYANPLDDGPRLVYADLLAERGDPRGELIVLQMKRKTQALDTSEINRERALLKKHMKEWLGPLATVLGNTQSYSGTRFERGFVAIADVSGSAEKRLPTTWNAREWATVEEVVGGWQELVLANAALRGLRRVRNALSLDRLDIFRDHPERFRHVEQIEVWFDDLDGRRSALVGSCAGLPALRELSIFSMTLPRTDHVAFLLTAPVTQQLARMVFVQSPVELARVADANRAFERFVETVAAIPGHVPTVALVPPWQRARGAPIELVREGGRYVRRPA